MTEAQHAWHWPLIGRDHLLHDARRALSDHGAVLLSGVSGVGKTRVLRALADEAAADGSSVRYVTGTESARSIALGAVADLVPPSAIDEPRDDLLRALVTGLEALSAASGNLFVVCDDAHLLDEASATLISLIVRRHVPQMSVVIAARSGQRVPDALVALWRDDRLARVIVDPIDDTAMTQLLGAVLGAAIDPMTLRSFARWTRGNVLYLRELVADGLRRGVLRKSKDVWVWHGAPTMAGSLVELIESRHSQLDPRLREALEVVAIGEPLPDTIALNTVDEISLDELETEGLVERDHQLAVRVSHPLHAEALRRSVASGRANRIRRQLAAALAATDQLKPYDELRIALWRADAGSTDDADAFVVAARHAWALRDTTLVERLAGAALRCGPNHEAAYLLGEAHSDRGEYEQAVATWTRILEDEIGDSLRARVATALATILAMSFNSVDAARGVLEDAADRLANPDDRARVEAASAAMLLGHKRSPGDSSHPGPNYEDATLRADARVFAWIGAAREQMSDGLLDAPLSEVDAIVKVAEEAAAEFPLADLFVGVVHFFLLLAAGRLDDAEDIVSARYDKSLNDPMPLGPASWSQALGLIALYRGHLEDAERRLRFAAALVRPLDSGPLRLVTGELAMVHALSGDEPASSAALEESQRAQPGMLKPHIDEVRVLAARFAARNDTRAACSLLTEHLEAHRGLRAWSAAPILHDLVRYGSDEQAAGQLSKLAETFDGALVAAWARQAEAIAARDFDALARSAERFDDLGCDLDAAESWSTLAAWLRRRDSRGDQRAATATERRSAEAVGRCGSTRPRTPMLTEYTALDPLTDREREVARLVASGLTDAEVARRLAVSIRTVHAHLRAVYRKLGVSTRADLADQLT